MAELIDTAKDIEKVILIGVCTSENDDTEESLDELEELVKTAGAVTLEKMIQNRESVHPGTYIGTGKIEEVLPEGAAIQTEQLSNPAASNHTLRGSFLLLPLSRK